MKSSRRGFFGFLLGGVATAVLPKRAVGVPMRIIRESVIPRESLLTAADLNEITKVAFVPKVWTQVYTQSPFLSLLNQSDDD